MNIIFPSKLIFSILTVLVLFALGNYLLIMQLSTPAEQDLTRKIKTPQFDTSQLKTQESTNQLESVKVMLIGLKQRLETQKNDVDGWVLLSKSYYHLNLLEEANQAFQKAKALGYAGDWMPLPRIDSFMHQQSSSEKLKALANFRDNNIDESVGQQ